jgi:hypothetical protein
MITIAELSDIIKIMPGRVEVLVGASDDTVYPVRAVSMHNVRLIRDAGERLYRINRVKTEDTAQTICTLWVSD